jgi:HAD superfamily hydrolase (TIGR01509 family)
VPIRGFLFDLDGTLVDSERESVEALARALAAGQGIDVDHYDREFVIGKSWVAIYASLKMRHPSLTWDMHQLIAQTATHREHVIAEHGIHVMPGAREMLAWTAGRPRALVTGSSRVEVMQVLPLIAPADSASFDVIFAAEDVPASKPAPDGYLMALAALGLAPHECVVIEDSTAGITAGLAAGCIVVGVRAGNFGGWDQSHAHCLIDSLDAFTPSLLDELAAIDPRDYGSAMPGSERTP